MQISRESLRSVLFGVVSGLIGDLCLPLCSIQMTSVAISDVSWQ